MRISFTKIVLPIDLGEYHESYAGQLLQVWVNPPREKRYERENIIKEFGSKWARLRPYPLQLPPRGEREAMKKMSRLRSVKSTR